MWTRHVTLSGGWTVAGMYTSMRQTEVSVSLPQSARDTAPSPGGEESSAARGPVDYRFTATRRA
ncbi:hypothetical protein GCM10010177_52700 [Actinomadura citrea]|nr:hypothetical protein GCM10010177_52700 [Actinomadura citrea]